MSLQNLKQQARQLSISERLELVSAIIESLQDSSSQQQTSCKNQIYENETTDGHR